MASQPDEQGSPSEHVGVVTEEINGDWRFVSATDGAAGWAAISALHGFSPPVLAGDTVRFHVVEHAGGSIEARVLGRFTTNARTFVGQPDDHPAPSTSNLIPAEALERTELAGVVADFNEERGLGTITAQGGRYFVHRSAIAGTGYRYLVAGEPVTFLPKRNEVKRRDEAEGVKPPEFRRPGRVASFDNEKGFGFIKPQDGSREIFFHHSAILRHSKKRAAAELDEVVEYQEEVGAKGTFAAKIKRLDPREPLYRFADMGNDDTWLAALKEAADDEDWRYHKAHNPCQYPILRSYILYTYARLAAEAALEQDPTKKKIQHGEDEAHRAYSCFNTGLVTPNQEPIYALFTSKSPNADGRGWRWTSFCTKSDRKLMGAFRVLPEMAHYFDTPSDLIFDRNIELELDIDHILLRLDRFPEAVRDEIKRNPGMGPFYLDTAKARAVSRVKRNYKTAIPAYYQGHVQLLLPMFLESDAQADLALTVTRVGSHYVGSTVLTLDMAYNNARLLTKPDTEWLKP